MLNAWGCVASVFMGATSSSTSCVGSSDGLGDRRLEILWLRAYILCHLAAALEDYKMGHSRHTIPGEERMGLDIGEWGRQGYRGDGIGAGGLGAEFSVLLDQLVGLSSGRAHGRVSEKPDDGE